MLAALSRPRKLPRMPRTIARPIEVADDAAGALGRGFEEIVSTR